MLDVKRIRVLREVVQQGSFSGAADALHLSQSAISQQVAALEREVGQPLLERTSDGPKLTAAGEVLISHGDAVLARLDEAERELAEIAGMEAGRLRLMSFPTASAALVTRAMADFRARFPNIELHFAEGEPEDSIPALRSGEIDIAVAFDYPVSPEDFGRDTEAELILEEPMRIALPPGHPLAASKTVEVGALADEDWLCGDRPSSCREHVHNVCRDAGFEPRISFESDDYQVLQGLVAAGLGVTLLPDLAGDYPGMVLRDIVPETPIRRVWAVAREAASRSPATAEMVSVLKEVGERHRSGEKLRAVA
ncbi:MAG: LysR family transcriptional regulator [Solirubrobacterales bacterium]